MIPNTPAPLPEIVRAHRALALLRMLNALPGYRSNSEVALDWLSQIGLACGHEALRTKLAPLEEAGLITLIRSDNLQVLSLTARGQDAAQGLICIDGVAVPGPQCPY